MKCTNCGNELPNDALFCENCGRQVQNVRRDRTSFCSNCGSELEAGTQFCRKCGFAVNKGQYNEPVLYKSEKKSARTGIIIALLSVICVASISIIVGYLIYSGSDDNADNSDAAATVTATAEPENTEQATETEYPISTVNPKPDDDIVYNAKTPALSSNGRVDLYSPYLTYKSMPEIHNTVLVDNDEVFYLLQSIITEFDYQCEDYMNEITDLAPIYLKPGSRAYNQQVSYKNKHTTLNQSYRVIDVINARQGNGYYYVWVTEVLDVNEYGKAQVQTSHWVYKIENNYGSWYICDYTADPAF